MKNANAIPVIYYHRVNRVDGATSAVTPELFARQIEALTVAGWKTIRLDELRKFVAGDLKLPPKSFVITFDDGYLDNWVYAYPILKKFDQRAAVFVVTNRITHGEIRRKSDEAGADELPEILDFRAANLTYLKDDSEKRKAFLTWEELQVMEASGVWEVGSHTHSHGMRYISDKVEGIIGGAEPHWTRGLPIEGDMRVGTPYFPKASRMMGRGYFDDPRLRDELVQYLDSLGGLKYLKRNKEKIQKELIEKAQALVETKYPGTWEKPEERSKGLIQELTESKQIIEKELGRPVYDLCWPWGECDTESVDAARLAGFKAAFTVRRSPVRQGDDIFRLGRIKIINLEPKKLIATLSLYSKPIIGTIFGKFSGTGRDK